MTAVVFLADGFEEVEALTPVDFLRRSKVDVITVAVPSSTMTQKNMVTSSHKMPVIADMTLEEFKSDFESKLPDLVFAPGGMPGSTNLAACTEVVAFFEKCYAAGKYVSAICAAPAVLLGSKTNILQNKKWTCFPGMNVDVPSQNITGSVFCGNQPFVTDKNVITGKGAGAAEQFADELVRLLCGEEALKSLVEKTCQR